MLWDCPHCGCQSIAPSLEFCPQCFAPREDVAAEPGQPVEGSSSTVPTVGSPVPELSSPALGDNSAAAPSSLKSNEDPDWGKA